VENRGHVAGRRSPEFGPLFGTATKTDRATVDMRTQACGRRAAENRGQRKAIRITNLRRRAQGAFWCMAMGAGVVACGAMSNTAKTGPPNLAVFRSERVAGDALPEELVTALEGSPAPEFDRSGLAYARRVLPSRPGWLVPSRNGEVCLVRLVLPLWDKAIPGGTPPGRLKDCASDSAAERGSLRETQSLSATERGSGKFLVIGVVPDSVAYVTVETRRRDHVKVWVSRNTYEDVVEEPTAVSFVIDARGGATRRRVPLTTFGGDNMGPE